MCELYSNCFHPLLYILPHVFSIPTPKYFVLSTSNSDAENHFNLHLILKIQSHPGKIANNCINILASALDAIEQQFSSWLGDTYQILNLALALFSDMFLFVESNHELVDECDNHAKSLLVEFASCSFCPFKFLMRSFPTVIFYRQTQVISKGYIILNNHH